MARFLTGHYEKEKKNNNNSYTRSRFCKVWRNLDVNNFTSARHHYPLKSRFLETYNLLFILFYCEKNCKILATFG